MKKLKNLVEDLKKSIKTTEEIILKIAAVLRPVYHRQHLKMIGRAVLIRLVRRSQYTNQRT